MFQGLRQPLSMTYLERKSPPLLGFSLLLVHQQLGCKHSLCVTMGFYLVSALWTPEQEIIPSTVHGSKKLIYLFIFSQTQYASSGTNPLKLIQSNYFSFGLGFYFHVSSSHKILQKLTGSWYSCCLFWDETDLPINALSKTPHAS